VFIKVLLTIGKVPELIKPVVKTELKPVDDAVLDAVKGCKADHVTPHQVFP
jgi:hypothetical protein